MARTKTKMAARFTLRIPRPLKGWLEAQAEENDRSMNGQIEFLLELARLGVQQPRPLGGGQPAAGEASRA
ncbi:Arc family DNA-binding protein [Pararoseomonas indoligenes]|uniref:Arc family DNA-binding protein n=1 Tax=Roseomonas indoligenes TaxID=2820811 RepID=A0A940S3E9_9PROT|nr:Arc family DNA-binding protein [Pararoseomonas indoligenes]MBP0492161.1 Arc family DNA-binding protein [Pararoseomonas indoligenes]